MRYYLKSNGFPTFPIPLLDVPMGTFALQPAIALPSDVRVWSLPKWLSAFLRRCESAMISSGHADTSCESCSESEFGSGAWTGCSSPPPPPPPEDDCRPAYPDVFIPSPPPDLDCGDIPYRNFVVLPPRPASLCWRWGWDRVRELMTRAHIAAAATTLSAYDIHLRLGFHHLRTRYAT